jgi:anthranilate synthase/aminodeoxychorismate synthase-like glutamine amidotransferase
MARPKITASGDNRCPAESQLPIAVSSWYMVFVLDNYDSFTYNLVQYLGELGVEVEVRRNDRISIDQIGELHPSHILISPGPCTPQDAGISIQLIRHFAGKVPLLGVCLGHQAIGAAFGGEVVRAKNLMHGKTSMIEHDGRTIFQQVPSPMQATRYHSLVVKEETLPHELEVSAHTRDADGSRVIMGIRHKRYPVEGVQFHPESVLTSNGRQLIRNFLAL